MGTQTPCSRTEAEHLGSTWRHSYSRALLLDLGYGSLPWGDLSHLTGQDYERYVLRTPRAVAGAVGAAPGTVHALAMADLDALLDTAETTGLLSHEETEAVALANRVFVHERSDTPAVYYVVEVSITARAHDVARAVARARLLARAGVDARPLVISDQVAPDALGDIEAKRVAWRRIPSARSHPTVAI